MESRRGRGTSPDPISNVRPDPSERRLLTGTSLVIDLCVTATLDALKAGVTLPRRTTEASTNDAPVVIPSAVDIPACENRDHALATDAVDPSGKSLTTVDPVSESTGGFPSSLSSSADISPTSPEPDATPKQLCQLISLSNFEQALEEITHLHRNPLVP